MRAEHDAGKKKDSTTAVTEDEMKEYSNKVKAWAF